MAAQQVSGVKLATGNIAAHFDPATPPLKPALRLPAAARRTVSGLLAATGASALMATMRWKRHHR